MTALAATDFTVTVEKKAIEPPRKRYRVKLVFGDGAKTYSTGGIPLPAKGSFGMVAFLEFLNLIDSSAGGGFVWQFDKTNNKLKAFVEATVATNTPLAEASAAFAPASTTLWAEAVGW